MGRDITIGRVHGTAGGRRPQPPGAPRGGLVVVDIEHDRTAHPHAELHAHVRVGQGSSGAVDPRHIVPTAASLAHQHALAFPRRALPET